MGQTMTLRSLKIPIISDDVYVYRYEVLEIVKIYETQNNMLVKIDLCRDFVCHKTVLQAKTTIVSIILKF